MEAVKNLVFVFNAAKPGAAGLAAELAARAKAAGRGVRITSDYPVPDAFIEGCDACCVIGGDGTLLSVAPGAARVGARVFGVNMGKLGFLAMFQVDEARTFFDDFLAGNFRVSDRALLECRSASGELARVLNDVVISANTSRVARLRVVADGSKLVNLYSADGLVVSTPTGSTAYNLSAGGALIHPRAPVLAVTPICPHTLSNRGLIVGDQTTLSISVAEGSSPVRVTCDGLPCFSMEKSGGLPLQVKLAKDRLPLILRPGYTYFGLVRTKLGWKGDPVADHEPKMN